ncbi:MAG: cytochrome c [Gammaproteobacteria bacterium]|nr:MAG: cytochrome c [Gammaproteobacteria bacterium]
MEGISAVASQWGSTSMDGVWVIARALCISSFLSGSLAGCTSDAKGDESRPEGIVLHAANHPTAIVGNNLRTTRALAADQYESPEQMYQVICAQCHDIGVGPVLAGRSLPPQYIATVLRNGRAGMPSFRPTELSDADVQQLTDWLGRQPAPPDEKAPTHDR